jgi:hypothetical protein
MKYTPLDRPIRRALAQSTGNEVAVAASSGDSESTVPATRIIAYRGTRVRR